MPILHWLTREQDLHASGRAPYRLLEHVESYGNKETQKRFIKGDNLDVLNFIIKPKIKKSTPNKKHLRQIIVSA